MQTINPHFFSFRCFIFIYFIIIIISHKEERKWNGFLSGYRIFFPPINRKVFTFLYLFLKIYLRSINWSLKIKMRFYGSENKNLFSYEIDSPFINREKLHRLFFFFLVLWCIKESCYKAMWNRRRKRYAPKAYESLKNILKNNNWKTETWNLLERIRISVLFYIFLQVKAENFV